MGNSVGCGDTDTDTKEMLTEGTYKDRVRQNNYSRVYRGNKQDPRWDPYQSEDQDGKNP